jgi:chaperone modulatory protein CbpM
MSDAKTGYLQGQVVENEIHLSLLELCQACSAREEQVTAWVFEGVLEPAGAQPRDWRFGGRSLQRARVALRISRDLEINPPGVALALDLLEEIATLQAQLLRHGTTTA